MFASLAVAVFAEIRSISDHGCWEHHISARYHTWWRAYSSPLSTATKCLILFWGDHLLLNKESRSARIAFPSNIRAFRGALIADESSSTMKQQEIVSICHCQHRACITSTHLLLKKAFSQFHPSPSLAPWRIANCQAALHMLLFYEQTK